MNSLITRRSYPTSPLASLLNLSRDFDRLFEAPLSSLNRENLQEFYAPPIEVLENADAISVSVEVPGVDKKDVSVSLHEGILTIRGERKREREVKENEVLRTERYYGQFQRELRLNQPLAEDKVKAAYKDGILTITLPKAVEAKPKTIEIAA